MNIYHSPYPFQDFLLSTVEPVALLDDSFVVTRLLNSRVIYLLSKNEIYGDVFSGYSFLDGIFSYGSAPADTEIYNSVGAFTYLKNCSNGVFVGNDLFGLGRIYLHEYNGQWTVSNRYQLILEHVKNNFNCQVSFANFSSSLFQYNPVFSQRLSRESDCLEIKQIPLGEYLFIDESLSVQVKKNQFENLLLSHERTDYDVLMQKACDEILANIKSIIKSGIFEKYIVDLSGGLDSRAVLAAFMNFPEIKDKIQIRALDVPGTPDIDISTGISKLLGLNYLTEDNRLFRLQGYEDALDRSISYTMGEYYRITLGTWQTNHHNHKEVRFTGGCGELYRAIYLKGNRQTENIHAYCNQINTGLFGFKSNSAVDNLKNELLELPGSSDSEKIENHYLYYRNRLHYGLREYDFFIDRPMFFPLVSKYLFMASRAMSSFERSSEKIMLDITHRLFPLLACITYAAKGAINLDLMSYQDARYKDLVLNISSDVDSWSEVERFNVQLRNSRRDYVDNNLLAKWSSATSLYEADGVEKYNYILGKLPLGINMPILTDDYLVSIRKNKNFHSNFFGLIAKTYAQL